MNSLAAEVDDLALSDDSAYVVYTNHSDLLYSVAVSGGSATLLSPVGEAVEDFMITSDSSQVVFTTSVESGSETLYSVPVGGGSATTLDSFSSESFAHLEVDPHVSHVGYFTSGNELYSADLAGASSPVQLNQPSAETAGMSRADDAFAFSIVGDVFLPGDGYVYYVSDETSTSDFSVFRVPLAGGTSTQLVPNANVVGGEADYDIVAADSAWVHVRGDYDGTEGQVFAVRSDLATPSTPIAVSAGEVPGADELTVSGSLNHLIYAGDGDGDGVDDLIAIDLAARTESQVSRPSLSGTDFDGSHDGRDFEFTPDGAGVVYTNDEVTAGESDLFYSPLGSSAWRQLSTPSSMESGVTYFYLNPDSSSAYFLNQDSSGTGATELFRSEFGASSVTAVGFSGTVSTFDVWEYALGSDGQSVVYTAYQDSAYERELYSKAVGSSAAPVKVNPTLASGGGVWDPRIVEGGEWVVYEASLISSSSAGSETDVLVSKLDGSLSHNLTNVTSGETGSIESLPAGGEHLLYVHDGSGDDDSALWHLDLTALPSLVVTEVSSGASVSSVRVSEDGSTAFYCATDTSTGVRGFYAVELSNPSSSTLLSEEDVRIYRPTPDGTAVVYTVADSSAEMSLHQINADGSSATALRSELYRIHTVVLSDDGAKVAYNSYGADLGAGGDLWIQSLGAASYTNLATLDYPAVDELLFSPDGAKVVYHGFGLASGKTELHSVSVDGSGGTTLNDTLASGGNVSEFAICSDSQTVVYRADRDADGKFELFSVDIGGGTLVRINDPLTATRQVQSDWSVSADGSYVVYRADPNTVSKFELFSGAVDGSGSSRLSMSLSSDEDVLSFLHAPDHSLTLYLADAANPDSFDLHGVRGRPGSGGIADQVTTMNVPKGPIGFTVFDLETPDGSLAVSATSSDPTLIRDANITIAGSGTTRQITLVPEPGVWGGPAQIDVSIGDGVHVATESFEFRITPDPNDPPFDITAPPAAVPENMPVGAFVTSFQTLDPDPWDFHEYTLVAGVGDVDNSSFKIGGNALLADAVFDFELKSSYSVRVRSTDFAGAFTEKVFSVSIIDLSGCPTDFGVSGRMDSDVGFAPGDFESRFVLKDGGALDRVRLASPPSSGQMLMRFRETAIDTTAIGASGVAVGDLNNDVWLDAAAVSVGDNSLRWYRQSGTSFVPSLISNTLIGAADVCVGDVNGDGALDLVTAAAGSGKIDAWINSGGAAPTFSVMPIFSGAIGALAVEVFDFDADGDLDIVSASPGDHRVILHQNLNPGWVGTVLSASETTVSALAIGDLDGDGDPDIACANDMANEIAWFENKGTPTFVRHLAGVVTRPVSLVAEDLDGDGDLDLAASSSVTNSITGLVSDGAVSPSFATHSLAAGLAGAGGLSSGDLDGDGRADLLCAVRLAGAVAAFRNRGGSPPVYERFDITEGAALPSEAVMADVNSNGRMDVVAVSAGDDTVSWFEDEVVLAVGDEIDTADLARVFYRPAPGFVGKDSFGWEGHDGSVWSANAATVEVSVYGSEYWDWLMLHFGFPVVSDSHQKATVWGPSADADGDEEANIYEYALGTDPNDGTDAGSKFDVVSGTAGDGLDYLYPSYYFRKAEPDLTYTLEYSEDLSTWVSGGVAFASESQTGVDSKFDEVVERVVTDMASEERQFVRLSVEWALD